MTEQTPFKRNQLVHIGNGKKVYLVQEVLPDQRVRLSLVPGGRRTHPDAGLRLPDALIPYPAHRIKPVDPTN